MEEEEGGRLKRVGDQGRERREWEIKGGREESGSSREGEKRVGDQGRERREWGIKGGREESGRSREGEKREGVIHVNNIIKGSGC